MRFFKLTRKLKFFLEEKFWAKAGRIIQPGISHAWNIDHDFPKVMNRKRIHGENVPSRVEVSLTSIGIAAFEQVFDVELPFVGEFCDGVANEFEQGDPGVMDIVIRPDLSSNLLEMGQARLTEQGVVLALLFEPIQTEPLSAWEESCHYRGNHG